MFYYKTATENGQRFHIFFMQKRKLVKNELDWDGRVLSYYLLFTTDCTVLHCECQPQLGVYL